MTPASICCDCDYCGESVGQFLIEDDLVCQDCYDYELPNREAQALMKATIALEFGILADNEFNDEIDEWVREVVNGNPVRDHEWISDLTSLTDQQMLDFVTSN